MYLHAWAQRKSTEAKEKYKFGLSFPQNSDLPQAFRVEKEMLGVGQHLHGEGAEKPARGVTKQYICVQCQISGCGVWWGFI